MSYENAVILTVAVLFLIVALWVSFPRAPLVSGVITLVMSWTSLIFAYGLRSSTAWKLVYGRGFGDLAPEIGGLIEAARSLLLVVIMYHLIGGVFRQEMRNLSRMWRSPGWWLARALLLMVACPVAYKVIGYHLNLSEAPAFLEGDSRWKAYLATAPQLTPEERGPDGKAVLYAIPYRWYLPYSLVIYLVVAVSLLVAPVIAYVRNVRYAGRTMARLHNLISRAVQVADVRSVFLKFRERCANTSRGFLELLAFVAFVFAFELFCRKPHSERASCLLGVVCNGGARLCGALYHHRRFFLRWRLPTGAPEVRGSGKSRPRLGKGKRVGRLLALTLRDEHGRRFAVFATGPVRHGTCEKDPRVLITDGSVGGRDVDADT